MAASVRSVCMADGSEGDASDYEPSSEELYSSEEEPRYADAGPSSKRDASLGYRVIDSELLKKLQVRQAEHLRALIMPRGLHPLRARQRYACARVACCA